MVQYGIFINLVLMIFNLIPVPPLDGYHVLNDLLLKKSPFASEKVSRIAYGILLALIFFTPVISKLILFVEDLLMTGLGSAMYALLCAVGLV